MVTGHRTSGNTHNRPIGLEHLSAYEDPLIEFIAAAAAGGAASICLSVNHAEVLDSQGRPGLLARIADADLDVSMGDGFLLAPGDSLDGVKRQLDLLVELGAPQANVCAFEPDASVERDPGAITDLLGEFTRLARSAGVGVLIEFTPLSHVPSLAAAVRLIDQIGQPNLKIMVDTLHLARSGEGPEDLEKVDAALFGYCQLSDGPLASKDLTAYMMEAVYNRALPGDGELPLERILAVLPDDITVSAEVPLQRQKEAGMSTRERAQHILEATRRVVDLSAADVAR